MIDQSAGGQIGALLQSLAQSNPQVFQAIMQMVAAQRQQGVGGIGSLAPPALPGFPRPMPSPSYRRGPDGTTLDTLPPPQMGGGPAAPFDPNVAWRQATNFMQHVGGGPMPLGRPDLAHHLNNPNLAGNARDAIMGRPSNMAYEVGAFYPPGLDRFPMPSGTNAPPAYSGQPPQGGMWSMGAQGRVPAGGYVPQRSTPMPTGVGGGNQQPYTPTAYSSPMPEWSQPTGPKFMPPSGPKQYGTTQPPYTQPTGPKYMPPTGPKVFGQTTPAQPPAFAPSQPKVYPQPAPMAGDGTTGLDWYAQQAGN